MQEKTVINALLQIRQEARRQGSDALAHVDTVLVWRGVDPAKLSKKPPMPANTLPSGAIKRLFMREMARGGKTMRQLVDAAEAAWPHLSPEAVYRRVGLALANHKRKGFVTREGRVWKLVSSNPL